MKKLCAALLLAFPFLCHAEDVAINFTGIPLPQFVQSTYKAMLKRDYVISPELLAMDKPISVAVRSVKADELPQFVDRVLASQGVKSELRDGVYFLGLSSGGSGVGAAGLGGSSIVLSGHVSDAPGRAGVVDGLRVARSGDALDAVGAGRGLDDPDADRDVYRPRNRKPDFIAAVLNAAFLTKPASTASDYVVITGTEKQLAKMRKLAEQVDQPAHKVRISATFVEVSTSDSNSLGVSVIADVLGASIGVKLGDSSTGALTLRASNFQAVIDALASDGRFKQIAAPTAVVDNYEKGNLSFGDSVPTIAATTLDRNGNPIQQIQYQQSGVLLNVLPSVLGDGRINVAVDGQISSFSPTTTGVTASPTLSKRQVQTSVTVDDGELLMIGGLNSNKATSNRNGFSFLPKAWAVRTESSANTDLVLILCASVVQ